MMLVKSNRQVARHGEHSIRPGREVEIFLILSLTPCMALGVWLFSPVTVRCIETPPASHRPLVYDVSEDLGDILATRCRGIASPGIEPSALFLVGRGRVFPGPPGPGL